MPRALEEQSEHPIAAAIVREARERGVKLKELEHFESITGGGVRGDVDGREVLIGKPKLIRERAVGAESLEEGAGALQNQGRQSCWWRSTAGSRALLSVADVVKASTPEAIAALHAAGIKIVMLTGDNARTAQAVATPLGIDRVEADARTG